MNKKEKPKSVKAEKKAKAIPPKKPKVVNELDMNQDACMDASKMECQLLHYLAQVKVVINMKELADVLGVSHSRITRIMDNLVERKYVSRRPSEEDRRCWYAEITEEGIKAAEAGPLNVKHK